MNFTLSDAHQSALSTLSPEDQKLVTDLWTSYGPSEVPEEKWRTMSSSVRRAFFSPFLKPTALSKRHHAEIAEKQAKAEAKAQARAAKDAEKVRKAAEKVLLAGMSPQERKLFKAKQKLQKQMDANNEPTLL